MRKRNTVNRCRRARELAGLSLGQAAELLHMTIGRLEMIEDPTVPVDPYVDRDLASIYHVSLEWLTGKVEQHDYATIDGIPGADKLTPHDRDVVAEFAALLPRKGTP